MSVSKAETEAIVKRIVHKAPPGELLEVIADIRVLVNNDPLLNKMLGSLCQEYNEQKLQPARIPGEPIHALVSSHTLVRKGMYAVPSLGMAFGYDHLRQSFTGASTTFTMPSKDAELRRSIAEYISGYVKKHYTNGAHSVMQTPSGIKILLSSVQKQPRNFWSAQWRTEWSVEQSGRQVTGKLAVIVHMYENGNVQLVGRHAPTLSCTPTAQAIAAAIKDAELGWHRAIAERVVNLEEVFKSLRLQLPITNTLLDFQDVEYSAVRDQLAK